MRFFAGSARNFIDMEAKPMQPYGSGPWPCANSLCTHYKAEVAERTDIQKMGDEIWAWFECPHCGMKYRRSKPDQSFEEYLKYKERYPSWKVDACRERTDFYRMRVMEELQERHVLSCKDLKESVPGAYEWLIRKEPERIHSKLTHEFDKPRWQEWREATLIELNAAYVEIQAFGDHRKRVNISWLAKVAGLNRDDIYGRLPYLP